MENKRRLCAVFNKPHPIIANFRDVAESILDHGIFSATYSTGSAPRSPFPFSRRSPSYPIIPRLTATMASSDYCPRLRYWQLSQVPVQNFRGTPSPLPRCALRQASRAATPRRSSPPYGSGYRTQRQGATCHCK